MIQVKGIRINALKPSYFVQTFTPPEKKDEKYWEKRGKNNIAARRFGIALPLCCSVPVKYKIKQIFIDTPDEDGSYAGSICSLTGHDISQAKPSLADFPAVFF